MTGNPVPPAPMVQEYRPLFQQAIEREKNRTILSSAPRLTEWLRNPENAVVARDDLSGLSWWETTLGAAGKGPHGFARVAAEIVYDDDVAFMQRGHENLFAQVRKLSPSIGPSISHGATARSWRKAARNVVVFQRPCGTLAGSLRPRGAHPRNGAMPVGGS